MANLKVFPPFIVANGCVGGSDAGGEVKGGRRSLENHR